MTYGLAADLVLLIHLAFVIFVFVGGLIVLRFPHVAWLHAPAALWGIYIELTGGICPLTTVENSLRHQAGQQGYTGDFIDHYIVPVLYPPNLTQDNQFLIAAGLMIINTIIYGWLIFKSVQKR